MKYLNLRCFSTVKQEVRHIVILPNMASNLWFDARFAIILVEFQDVKWKTQQKKIIKCNVDKDFN